MKIKSLLFIALAVSSCGQEVQQQSKNDQTCSVLERIQRFDFVSVLLPYEQFDRDKVFNAVIKNLKDIGEVHISSEKPTLDALLTHSTTSPMSAMLSIRKTTNDQMEASLKIGAAVKILANGCTKDCFVWENKTEVDLTNETKDRTEEALQLVDEILQNFKKEYSDANPHAKEKPVFEVINVDLRT